MAARREQQARGGGGDGIDASGEGADLTFLRLLMADMNAAPDRRLRGSLRSMLQLDLGAEMSALAMPILFACGDRDQLIPLTSLLATFAKYPAGSGLHVWHGVGHSPNVDVPRELAALIAAFLRENAKAA